MVLSAILLVGNTVSEMDEEFDDEQLDDDILTELYKFGDRLFREPDKKAGKSGTFYEHIHQETLLCSLVC